MDSLFGLIYTYRMIVISFMVLSVSIILLLQDIVVLGMILFLSSFVLTIYGLFIMSGEESRNCIKIRHRTALYDAFELV
ncbi:unnamed protein product [Larinioides sclopetarius]|uniref:NADH dehydrogenase subunit 4L n=1 Tax=Larinioides sclopetarius TaxID=280406 RepID=A0AAV1ZZD8_9ARAC